MASWRRLYGLVVIICAWMLFLAALFIIFDPTRDGVPTKTNLIAHRATQLGQEVIPLGSIPIKYSRILGENDVGSGVRTFKKTLFRRANNAAVLHVAWIAGSYNEEGNGSVARLHEEELFSKRREPVTAIGPNCTGPQKIAHPRMRAYNLLKLKRPNFLPNYKNPCWMKRRGEEEELRLFCVPFFFIIGQPKCGTTDLHDKISRHPQIARRTEFSALHWLARHRFGATFQKFARIFINHTRDFVQRYKLKPGKYVNNPLVFGDSSPSTFGDNSHWEELGGNEGCSEPRVVNSIYLYHILPQAKVILTLRDPVSRLYSSYHFFNVGRTPLGFHELAKEEVRVYEECFAQFPVRQCAYNNTLIRWSKLRTAVGFYSVYLKDWFKTFPRDQIYITILEERSKAPERELEKIFKFLRVAELHPGHVKEIAATPTKKIGLNRWTSPDMLEETREMLQEFYKPFNEELRNMLLESPNP